MTAERRFTTIQERYRRVAEREREYRLTVLLRKYGSIYPSWAWLLKGERGRLERLRLAKDKDTHRMHALLRDISSRDWYSSAPNWWIMTELTYADATTTGALNVVPPSAMGSTPADMRRFAA